jgi:cobalt-precorrin-5B (C1)-methyltransferase
MRRYAFAEEAYVMMGDYFEFSLARAAGCGFGLIHVSAQWAKMLKISMSTPETHVRRGALDVRHALAYLRRMKVPFLPEHEPNTARELYSYMAGTPGFSPAVLGEVVRAAKRYAMEITRGVPVKVHLVSYEGDILVDSEEDTCDRYRI